MWKLTKADDDYRVIDAASDNGDVIAVFPLTGDEDFDAEQKRNAVLFTKAADMRLLLSRIVDAWNKPGRPRSGEKDMLDVTIEPYVSAAIAQLRLTA